MKHALLLIGMLFASTSMASDGNALLKGCNAALAVADSQQAHGLASAAGFCLGLIQGVAEVNALYRVQYGDKAAFFCGPSGGVQNVQALRIVTKFLRDHPEWLHEEDVVLVLGALGRAFPCQK